jgi:hypothetical protein
MQNRGMFIHPTHARPARLPSIRAGVESAEDPECPRHGRRRASHVSFDQSTANTKLRPGRRKIPASFSTPSSSPVLWAWRAPGGDGTAIFETSRWPSKRPRANPIGSGVRAGPAQISRIGAAIPEAEVVFSSPATLVRGRPRASRPPAPAPRPRRRGDGPLSPRGGAGRRGAGRRRWARRPRDRDPSPGPPPAHPDATIRGSPASRDLWRARAPRP